MATVVTNQGLAVIVNRMLGAGTEPKYVHWGSGAGTAAVADTALFVPGPEARVAGNSSRVTGPAPSIPNDTYQVIGTLINGGVSAENITNAGLFDDPTAGTLFLKGDHATTPLNPSEGIQYTLQCQFKNT